MTRRRPSVAAESLVTLPLVALTLLAFCPTTPPRPPFALAAAIPVGLFAGTTVFAALARRVPTVRRRSAAAFGAGLTAAVAGASEEAIWRGFLLARIAPRAGIAAALVVTSIGFAATHFPALRHVGFGVHLGTGTVFGVVFVATGSLAACAVAHAVYNLLALLGREPRASHTIAGVHATPAVRFESVVKRFGTTVALDGFTFDVLEGEIVALLGPNGAGKTTAVSVLLGLRRPDAGAVELFGRDPRDWQSRTAVGMTPQEMSFPPTLRVREIVEFARAHYSQPIATETLLAQFGLDAVAGRQVGGISGGQRRRLAVALAFAGAPRLAVLDEPTSGLDVESRRSVWQAVREHAQRGGAVLLTTHHLDEAESLADRIVVASRGLVIADGPAQSLTAAGETLEDAYLRLTRSEA
jgi:ABC-2 type transport system ATP-binding protein